MGFSGEQYRSFEWWCSGQTYASGSQGAAIRPLVNGCRESEISLASGQPVIRLHGVDGLKAQVAPLARGMQRESASVSLAKVVLSDNTHLADNVLLLLGSQCTTRNTPLGISERVIGPVQIYFTLFE